MFSIESMKQLASSNLTGIKGILNDASYAQKIAEVIETTEDDVQELSFSLLSLFSGLSSMDDVKRTKKTGWLNPTTTCTFDVYETDVTDVREDLLVAAGKSPEQVTFSGVTYIGTRYGLSSGTKVFNCFITDDARILINGYQILYFTYSSGSQQYFLNVADEKELSTKLPEVFGLSFSLRGLCNDVVTGYSSMMEYASILKDAATSQFNSAVASTSLGVTSLIDRVRNSKWLSGLDKNALISNAQGGAAGITSTVLSWLSSFKAEAEEASEAGDATFLANTHIEIAKFSKGAILGAITAAASVVTMVLAAVSRLLGAIAAAVTTALSIVGKILLAATTDWDDTLIKVAADSSSTDNVFDFVINQGYASAYFAAKWMRDHGVNRATISLEPLDPVVTYVSLMYPDAPEDSAQASIISFEAHLSPNFDIFSAPYRVALTGAFGTISDEEKQALSSVTGIADPTSILQSMRWFGYRGSSGETGTYCLIIHNNSSEDRRYVALGCVNFHRYYSGTVDWRGLVNLPFVYFGRNEYAECMLPDDLCTTSYIPISFSVTSNLVNMFGKSNMQDILWRRLCSALLLIIYRYIVYPGFNTTSFKQNTSTLYASFLGLNYHMNTGIGYEDISVGRYTQNPVELDRGLCGLLAPVSTNADGKFHSGVAGDEADGRFVTGCDEVLTKLIEPWFDAVVFPQTCEYYRNMSSLNVSHMRFYPSYSSTTDYRYTRVVSTFLTDGVFTGTDIYHNEFMFGPTLRMNGQSIEWSDDTAVGFWPTKLGVTIPSLTFSGFIFGLIADGLIVAAIAATAIFATVGFVRLKNKQAQLQARAENAWYNYSEDYDNLSPEDRKQAWSAYKRARLKNNLLALVTGDGSLSLGLYDEGTDGDASSIVDRIRGFAESDENAEEISLDSIHKDITGLSFGE